METCLDLGISERDFWEMTIGEIERATKSKIRVQQREAKQKATFDYILAQLIGCSVAKVLDKDSTFPTLEDTYSSLFKDETKSEQTQKGDYEKEPQMDISAVRILQFAEQFNLKYDKEAENRSEE